MRPRIVRDVILGSRLFLSLGCDFGSMRLLVQLGLEGIQRTNATFIWHLLYACHATRLDRVTHLPKALRSVYKSQARSVPAFGKGYILHLRTDNQMISDSNMLFRKDATFCRSHDPPPIMARESLSALLPPITSKHARLEQYLRQAQRRRGFPLRVLVTQRRGLT